MKRNFSRQREGFASSTKENVNARFIRTNQSFYKKRPTNEPKESTGVGKVPSSILKHEEQHNESMCICVSGLSEIVVQGFEDGKLGVWNMATKEFTRVPTVYSTRPVRQVCVSHDGSTAAAIFLDGTFVVFSTKNLDKISVMKLDGFVQGWGITISSDGSVVYASLAQDRDLGKIIRLDVETKEMITIWIGHTKIFELQCSHDGSRLMFFRQNNVVNVIDIVEGLKQMPILYSFEYMKGNYDAAMDAKGETLTISEFKTVLVHKLMDKGKHESVSAENYNVQWNTTRKVDITADGSRFTEMKRRGVIVRDTSDGKVLLALQCTEKLISSIISADGKTVIGSDYYGNLIVWSLEELSDCDTSFLNSSTTVFAKEQEIEDVNSVFELEEAEEENNEAEDSIDPTSTYGKAVENFESTVVEEEKEIPVDEAKEKLETLVKSTSSMKNIPDDLESVVSDAVSEVVGAKETVDKGEYGAIAETVTSKLEDVEVPAEWERHFDNYAGRDNILSLHQAVTVLIEVWEKTSDTSKTRYPTKPKRLELRKVLITFDADNDLLIGKDEFLNTLRYVLEPIKT